MLILNPDLGSTPTKLPVEDVELNDPKSMADAFNNFFANIGNNLTKNIPSVNKSPFQYLTAPSHDSFFLFPTTTVEIDNEILGLNANKSTGLPNMLYLHLLKLFSMLPFLPELSQIYLK